MTNLSLGVGLCLYNCVEEKNSSTSTSIIKKPKYSLLSNFGITESFINGASNSEIFSGVFVRVFGLYQWNSSWAIGPSIKLIKLFKGEQAIDVNKISISVEYDFD